MCFRWILSVKHKNLMCLHKTPSGCSSLMKRTIEPDNDKEDKRDINSKSMLPPINTVAKRRSVLDDNTHGPGNIPHGALSKIRFPNLSRALHLKTDTNTRKWVSSLYHVIA